MDLDKAFSLIEFLLALIISSFLFFIAVPNMQGFFASNRALRYAGEIRSALKFSRFSAIKLGEPVKFCGSSTFKGCDGSWQEGRIIVTELGKILRVYSKIFDGDKLGWKGTLGNSGIIFLPTGVLKKGQGTFSYCPNGRSENAIAVILNLVGRVRIDHKNSRGETISCNF